MMFPVMVALSFKVEPRGERGYIELVAVKAQ